MKKQPLYLILFLAMCFPMVSMAQMTVIKSKIDSLQYVDSNFRNCTTVYSRILSLRKDEKDGIKLLIDKLDDQTSTKAKVECYDQTLVVGDLAYLALRRLIDPPLTKLIPVKFVNYVQGCYDFSPEGVFRYLTDDDHRAKFKAAVANWYNAVEAKYTWEKIPDRILTDCEKANKKEGAYIAKEKNGK